jgi:hypothetical protein
MQTAHNFFGSTVLEESANRKSSLDIIMYVASLASSPQAIDPTLDTVRSITARLEPGEPLSVGDAKELSAVYFKIEDYLTHDEPLQQYTKESIRAKVLKKFQLGSAGVEAYWQQASTSAEEAVRSKPIPPETIERSKHLRVLGRRVIVGSLLLGLATFFIPTPPVVDQPWSKNADMAFSVAAALLLFGGGWLFLRGLSGFKVRFKIIYRLLCAAMVLLALAQSQQVVYTYFDLWSVPLIKHGGVAAGFAPAILLFYISVLLFARLLKVTGFASSLVVALVVSGVVAILSTFIPYIPSPLPESVVRQALLPSLFLDTLMIFATLMVASIKKVASPAFTPALAWLLLAFIAISIIGIFYTFVQVMLPEVNPVLSYGGISALFIIPGILLVKSGVVFNEITEN